MSLDLHIHSKFSDGTMSPREIIIEAKKRGLTAISITDHDTADGVYEALVAGEEHGVEVLAGIELSVEHHGTYMHILGYFFDPKDTGLLNKLERVQVAREKRNGLILEKLGEFGMKIDNQELQIMSEMGQTGRPHIARIMVEKGYVASLDEAFRKYLRKDMPAYAPRFVYSSKEAIDMISSAGGYCVLAHPVQIDRTFVKLNKIVRELAEMGLCGLEVFYPTHSSKIRKKLRKIAEQYGLVLTGGSDYHGAVRANTSMAGGKNVTVPSELLEKMKKKLATQSISK